MKQLKLSFVEFFAYFGSREQNIGAKIISFCQVCTTCCAFHASKMVIYNLVAIGQCQKPLNADRKFQSTLQAPFFLLVTESSK